MSELINSGQPLVSVVMPTFNSASYIGKAVESVIGQSYPYWELIIVDDASTDNTEEVIKPYVERHSNIRYFKMSYNSGSARQPRLFGVKEAKGKWISTLDSDDFLDKNCLQLLIARQKETAADIVLGQMVEFENGSDRIMDVLPKETFDTQKIYTGKEACAETIGGWNIAFIPTLIRSDMYKTLVSDSNNMMLMDEIDTRRLLLMSKAVAFCESKYFYRNYVSISRKVTIRTFDQIELSFKLLDMLKDSFGVDSEVYSRQLLYCLRNLKSRCYTFKKNQNQFTEEQQREIKQRILFGYQRFTKEKHRFKAEKFSDKVIGTNQFCMECIINIRVFLKKIKDYVNI